MTIKVSCGYRIHINSVDMNGFNDRICGGIGFCVNEPKIAVTVAVSEDEIIDISIKDIVSPVVSEFRRRNNIKSNYAIIIDEPLKAHKGLGSTTLLKLCVLKGLHEISGLALKMEGAKSYDIGKVSGIGVGGFFLGGFIADGGYKIDANTGKTLNGETGQDGAPILFRKDFPSEWKVVLALPKHSQSISGQEETDFFNRITPIQNSEVHHIAYEVLMGALPSVMELNYGGFIKSLSKITDLGTKPFEEELNHKLCADVLAAFRQQFGFGAISSLGPAVYGFTKDEVNLDEFSAKFNEFEFYCTGVSNNGCEVIKIA